MKPKMKRDRDLKLLGFEILAENIFSGKKKCWMRIQNIRLFSHIQTSIMLLQKTQNSEGPGLSYWENHLKCWRGSKENSGDLHVYPNH